MPFVGENYSKSNSLKLLLIAESHYLPEDSTISKDAQKWYDDFSENDLTDEEKTWMHTRNLIVGNWEESAAHMIFTELERRMSNYIEKYKGNSKYDARSMNSCAFMNGFQRPSHKTGDSIKKSYKKDDFTNSTQVINEVLKIIKPELVIFVSKFAWDVLGKSIKEKNESINFDFVCHPGTGGRYWHNKNYPNGANKFTTLLSANKK
jgi:hypothetical protein